MPERLPEFTPEQVEQLRVLVNDGASIAKAYTTMGVTRHHVIRESERLGISWQRAGAMAAAVTEKTLSMRERRLAAAAVEMELLEWQQDRLRKAKAEGGVWKALVKGDKGAEYAEDMDFVPSRDLRDENSARVASITAIAKLDTTDPGVQAGVSMLEALAKALGVTGPTE